MLRIKSLRAVYALPVAFAVALLGYSSFAFADVAGQLAALNAKLQTYATSEGKTGAALTSYNVTTATADDLVYAVYELAQAAGDNPQVIADIAQAALVPAVQPATATSKVRADKDKVGGRIMEAAVLASSTSGPNNTVPPDQATIVDKVLQQLGTVNSGLGTAKALTAAGKQLLVAKALRSTTGLGSAIAARVQTSAFYPPAAATVAATDTARTTFTVAVLKLLAFKPITNDPAKLATTNTFFPIRDGAQIPVKGEPAFVEGTPPSIFGVRDYVDTVLDGYTQINYKATAATNIAAGVAATVPAAAGATIAGYVQDLKTNVPATTDANILSFLKSGVAAIPANGTTPAQAAVPGPVVNAKLAAAVSDIVADTFRLLTPGSHASDAVTLATSTAGTPAYSVTPALKGKIASGAIRANPSDATAVVTNIIALNDGTGKAIVTTGVAAFAGAAAQGNSSAAANITTAAINSPKLAFVPATSATPAAQTAAAKADLTKIQAVAIAVGKSIALVDPNVMTAVAESLFTVTRGSGGNPYSVPGAIGEASRQNLAVDLVKGLAANYDAAGAAVSGVVHQSLVKNPPADATAALNQTANITGFAIKAGAKAAVSISLRVAANVANQSFYAGTTTSQLAAAIASNANVASTSAGAVAAGVSLADTAHTGLITAAVINSGLPGSTTYNARQAAALTIANTVAVNVDVEAIGLIAQSVIPLLQPSTGSSSKLPKLSTSVGTLATSLAKAINLKPLVTWNNRVDELSELAAEMTKRYLLNPAAPDGADATAATAVTEQKALVTALSAIGTSIFKGVSAKLLANTYNNQADVSDIANSVAGAIAQVIALSNLSPAVKQVLLATTQATGTLEKNLLTAATASKSTAGVITAFTDVSATDTAHNGTYGNVAGSIDRGDGTTGKYETRANYETGNVTANETPIKNI